MTQSGRDPFRQEKPGRWSRYGRRARCQTPGLGARAPRRLRFSGEVMGEAASRLIRGGVSVRLLISAAAVAGLAMAVAALARSDARPRADFVLANGNEPES